MSSCRQIDDQLVEWLYGELDSEVAREFASHVEQCESCASKAESFERTRQAFHSLPEEEPPAKLTAMLLHEAGAQAPKSATSGGIWAALVEWFQPILAHPGLAAAASLVVVVTIAGALYARHGEGMFAGPEQADSAAKAPVASRGDTEGAEAPAAAQPTELAELEEGDAFGDSGGAEGGPLGLLSKDAPAKADDPAPAAELAEAGYLADTADEKGLPGKLIDRDSERRLKRKVRGRYRSGGDEAAKPKPDSRNAVDGVLGGLSNDAPSVAKDGRAGSAGKGKPTEVAKQAPVDKSAVAANAPPPPPQKNKVAAQRKAEAQKAAEKERRVASESKKQTAEEVREQRRAAAGAAAPVSPGSVATAEDADESALESEADDAEKEDEKWSHAQEKRLRTALKRKRCGQAIGIADEIRDRSPEYYRRRIARGTSLSKCRQLEARRRAARERARKKAAKKAKEKSNSADTAEPAEAESTKKK